MLRSRTFKRLVDTMERFELEETHSYAARDEVFNFNRWNHHRNVTRYWRHIAYIVYSSVLFSLAPVIALVMLVALGVGVYETLLEQGMLPKHWPTVSVAFDQGLQQISFALSLLLVFRTNTAYARWWEGRKIWGMLTNRSRDFVRQSNAYVKSATTRDVLLRWTIALPHVLMAQLTQGLSIAEEVQGVLFPAEVAALLESDHRPSAVLSVLGDAVSTASVPAALKLAMDHNLTAFADIVGQCERIFKTPIPLSYSRHTSRFLVIWVMLMPSMLWSTCRWATIPISALCAFLMLGIDEIGVQIEEPFHVLPLGSICATIERNLRAAGHSTDALRAAVSSVRDSPRSFSSDSPLRRNNRERPLSSPFAVRSRSSNSSSSSGSDSDAESFDPGVPCGEGLSDGETQTPWDTPRARAYELGE